MLNMFYITAPVINMISILINAVLSIFYGNINDASVCGGDTKNSFVKRLKLKAENYRKLNIGLGGIKGYIYKSLNSHKFAGIKIINLEKMSECFFVLSAICVPAAYVLGGREDFLMSVSLLALNYTVIYSCAVGRKKMLFIELASEMLSELVSAEAHPEDKMIFEQSRLARAEASTACDNDNEAEIRENTSGKDKNINDMKDTANVNVNVNDENMDELIDDMLNDYL